MYLIYALCTTVCWGLTDMFAKKGTDEKDKSSHLKMVVIVGAVMGLNALVHLFIVGFDYSFFNIIRYLPVSFMYILSMTIGYAGLRYLEVSIISPVQNSSGAVVALMLFIFIGQTMDLPSLAAVILICLGVLFIAYIEKTSEATADNSRNQKSGAFALIFPILYCIIDAMGTFLDALMLDEEVDSFLFIGTMDENSVIISYGLTFFICGMIAFLYLYIVKKERITFKSEKYKGVSAIFETLGEITYVYALSDSSIIAAPLISSYCIFSVLFSRIFLKEKLSKKHYFAISAVIAGIVILAILEVL